MRDDLETLQKQNDEKDNELYQITKENLGLREKVEILESIIKSNKAEYENLVSAKVLSTMEKSTYEFHGGVKGKVSGIDMVY